MKSLVFLFHWRNFSYYYLLTIFIIIISNSCSSNSNEDGKSNEANQRYSILYHGNGHSEGKVPKDELEYKSEDQVVLLTKETLVKEGYLFDGWNTKADGSGEQYEEGASFLVSSSNVILYAQWLSEVIYHELILSNVSVIDILNVVPRPNDTWYHASVDVINGTLTLNDAPSDLKFQFQYKGLDSFEGEGTENKGHLSIKFNSKFHSASNAGRAIDLSAGTLISFVTFKDSGIAEISGFSHNWGDKSNRYIPVSVTKDDNTHYGYIKVSFKDALGQLTIHATAYNRIPEKEIVAGRTDD